MKKSKDLFGKLVEKIEIIQETQQGNLKGGFTSLSISQISDPVTNNCGNGYGCSCNVIEK